MSQMEKTETRDALLQEQAGKQQQTTSLTVPTMVFLFHPPDYSVMAPFAKVDADGDGEASCWPDHSLLIVCQKVHFYYSVDFLLAH